MNRILVKLNSSVENLRLQYNQGWPRGHSQNTPLRLKIGKTPPEIFVRSYTPLDFSPEVRQNGFGRRRHHFVLNLTEFNRFPALFS